MRHRKIKRQEKTREKHLFAHDEIINKKYETVCVWETLWIVCRIRAQLREASTATATTTTTTTCATATNEPRSRRGQAQI